MEEVLDALFKEKANRKSFQLVDEYFKKAKNNPLEEGPEVRLKNGLQVKWLGFYTLFAKIARMGKGELKEPLLPMMGTTVCQGCKGTRLNPIARNVRIGDLSISDVCDLSIEKGAAFLQTLSPPPFLKEIHNQALKFFSFLLSIGLKYLSLSRSAPTLSGGELQRIRLARQLGSGLTSCLYILDEPTIGLHPHNSELLNQALFRLRDLGNTLVLVEHDPMTLAIADYLFDFGPKAGNEGGKIVAHGTLEEIKQNPDSLTGLYLSGKKKIPIPQKRRKVQETILIENAVLHNLKNVTVGIPKGVITCLTGVSGSGKSSLMSYLRECKEFEKIIRVDQSPMGQTSRADVSTYSGLQPLMRTFFASLSLSLVKGLQPRAFSPNHIRGMCRTCWGLGFKMVHLQFLPSVRIPCDGCKGFRLNPISLEVKYRGKHFGEVLQMGIEEALSYFSEIPKIVKRLKLLISVGLGYLKLGAELTSLSGGEAQRLRLCNELSKRESGNNLYLIDEPTVGLHFEDISKLLKIFHELANKGNTLVIIEHNMDVVANADYVIDLGPDAGEEGGEIIAEGTPEEVAQCKRSKTAKYILQSLQFS